MIYLKVLTQNSPGGTNINHENPESAYQIPSLRIEPSTSGIRVSCVSVVLSLLRDSADCHGVNRSVPTRSICVVERQNFHF